MATDQTVRFDLGTQRLLLTAPAVLWGVGFLMRALTALLYKIPLFQPGWTDLAFTIVTGAVALALLWRAQHHRGAVLVDHQQAFIELPAGMASGDNARRAAIPAPPGRARMPYAGIRDVREKMWWIGRGPAASPRYAIIVRDDFGAVRFSLDATDRAAFFLVLGASPADPAPLARAWKTL